MKFLLSGGGIESKDDRFGGVICSPASGVPYGVANGTMWAADNQAFTKGFKPHVFFPWIEKLYPYQRQCLFVVVPDKVGNAWQTLALWKAWVFKFIEYGYPLAFVAQDGQEHLEFPDSSTWTTLFVGGTTKWKESPAAIEIIKRGQALNKHIHIGRVNAWRRYSLFLQIKGSEEFTCDGTRQRFDGIEKTKKYWAEYQKRLALPLF